jgi:hypothetical protein
VDRDRHDLASHIVFGQPAFPLIVNSIQGAREVDDNFLRVGQQLLGDEFSNVPNDHIAVLRAGLRTSIGGGAEFFMSSKGLGYFIKLKANALEMAPAFVAIVLLALFGIALVSLVTYIENRFCNW